MNALRIALIPLICVLAAGLAAGAIDLTSTGTNTAIGDASVQGDVFRIEDIDGYGMLYSGVWAHVYIPPGTAGFSSGDSERTVQARTEVRTFEDQSNTYELENGYGDSTVIAKASKTGVLGLAEAFSEISAHSWGYDTYGGSDQGYVGGIADLTAYVSHSGTGTANASAEGSSYYTSNIETGVVQASGSVNGTVALDASNNYGGSVAGAAIKESRSDVYSYLLLPESNSVSLEYLSLTSGRYSESAPSIIDGKVLGTGSSIGFGGVDGDPGKYSFSQSSTKGDLYSTASTYKLGDSIVPCRVNTVIYWPGMVTQLDGLIGTPDTGRTSQLYPSFIGSTPKASAYLISQSKGKYYPTNGIHYSIATTESFTSSSVTRTLADSNEAYGASYIYNGDISTAAHTSSKAGASPITMASSEVSEIFMGSGAHLISRLTGAAPASTADLTVESIMAADASGSVKVTGNSQKKMVTVVGPSYSPSGTSADATGSYLTADKIGGTAVHIADPTFTAASKLIADDISEIDIWSWASGDDPRSHAESSTGLFPFVSTPVYTSDPAGVVGVTEGPTATSGATATSRSIDTVFKSSI
ncbi:MAG TPA: hypothetical protein VN455_01235 [Methanotrichaceae archaeon]|nr:hypothetical protein [Methanotrichaceae archaeon]